MKEMSQTETPPARDTWNDGFDFAMKACGWQEGEDPSTEGLYVARDSKGNVEVGMWYAKTPTSPAEWTREFRDVDRDDIVAWMAIPDWRTPHYQRRAMIKRQSAITHCDSCGCDWLDNGLNPIGCPYCKLSAGTTEGSHGI